MACRSGPPRAPPAFYLRGSKAPDKGTLSCMSVLPRTSFCKSPPPMSKAQTETPSVSRSPLRVFIADDKSADVELMVATLKRAGYSLFFEAVNSPGAFQRRLEHAGYNLILSDHNLGSWAGTDALEMIASSPEKTSPFWSSRRLWAKKALSNTLSRACWKMKRRSRSWLPELWRGTATTCWPPEMVPRPHGSSNGMNAGSTCWWLTL